MALVIQRVCFSYFSVLTADLPSWGHVVQMSTGQAQGVKYNGKVGVSPQTRWRACIEPLCNPLLHSRWTLRCWTNRGEAAESSFTKTHSDSQIKHNSEVIDHLRSDYMAQWLLGKLFQIKPFCSVYPSRLFLSFGKVTRADEKWNVIWKEKWVFLLFALSP